MRRITVCLGLLIGLACADAAGAQHNQLDWISTGPTGSAGPGDTCAGTCGIGFTDDGGRVAFVTAAALVPSDTDTQNDVYLNDNGVVTRVSTGPTGGNGAFPALYTAATPDLSRIYFSTPEALVSPDADARWDLYQWSNGVTTLVSTGPAGGNGPYDVCLNGGNCLRAPGAVSGDGSHVFFATDERLTFDDIDSSTDVYDRTNGTTQLVSDVSGSYADFLGASTDGSAIVFRTTIPIGLYERVNGTTTQIPVGNRGFGFDVVTRDGSRVFFTTRASLVPSDQDTDTCVIEQGSAELFPDACNDVYEYSGGTITLVSAKPDGSGASEGDAEFAALSADEQHVFFRTGEQLVPEDEDGLCLRSYYDDNDVYHEYYVRCLDVYDRTGGTTRLISTGPAGGSSNYDAKFSDASGNGSHVLFTTGEGLVPGDPDGTADVYDRSGSATTRVSVGPLGSGGTAAYISRDGARILFFSANKLMPEDTDTAIDAYERFGGQTYLVTDFTSIHMYPPALASVPTFIGSTPDRRHVFVETPEALVSGDADACCRDLYEASVGPAVGYPRPKGATPVYVSLVPAYEQCTVPNRAHGAPLSHPSCASPDQSSGALTVGTPDSNGAGAKSIGFMTLAVNPGSASEADDADVRIALSLTDVRHAGTLADYTGELQGRISLRLTDNGRFAPITNPPQTVQDFPLSFTSTCTETASTTIGSSCGALTTADTLVPGMVRKGNRGLWELGQVQVYDGGPDGDVDTAGNSVFARQGLFIP